MAQIIELPFGALNNIPGVSGIDDIRFSIPGPSDIAAEVEDTLDIVGDVQQAVRTEVFDLLTSPDVVVVLVDEVVAGVRDAFTEVQEGREALADIVAERTAAAVGAGESQDIEIDLQGQLFALETEFERVIEAAFDDADLGNVGQFPTIAEIGNVVAEETPDITPDDIPGAGEIADNVVDELQERLADIVLAAGDIEDAVSGVFEDALDPILNAPIISDLDQAVDNQIDRVTDGLVSDEARQNLQERLDND